ncbi:restriction endonuclease subunit S [Psychrobacter arenosus]|uniref:restriction endonuclease subunit S n=1 Tax=Psychrobacter arenosus TaxID=256326 RepID=UPI00191B80D8|nr:restriction endonuclease subunit S [Psychrobacter arenosus]
MTPLTELLIAIVDNRGKTVPTSNYGTPLIATNCIKHSSIYPTFDNVRYVNEEVMQNWFRAHPKPNDIIFVNKGTPGRVCLVPDPVSFCFAQDMMGFRCDPKKIDYQYLFAVLRSKFIQQKIENFHVGLVIPHFRKGDLDHIKIPRLSSRQLELAVGNLYLNLSKKIEINNQINAELEAMAKTLYDYWFIQFDFPNADCKPYKSSGGKMVYNEVLKREIPERWEAKVLADIANITMGQSPSGSSYNSEGIGTIFFQGSTDFGWLFPTTRQYTTEPNRMAKKGDILLSVRAPVGTMNIAKDDCCIGRGLAALNSKTGSDSFLFYVMQYYKQIFDYRNSEGTTFGSINKDDLHSLPLAYPTSDLLNKYDEIVSQSNKLVFEKGMENIQLEELRDWLLPMLMNGQVTIS